MLASTRATVRRHAMLAGGETVLVAVSGGSDSVALLHVLRQLAPEWSLTLRVLHVDHQLRADSGREAAFVRALGDRLGVPVAVVPVTVDRGPSLEAAARVARYRALEAYADRIGAHRIAVGHTLDDQAETVLMRLVSGAGVRGLAAIPPVRGRIIRPLIAEPRAGLRAVLVDVGLDWIEDPSNRDPRFLRNRIRHELLPVLASSYNPDIVGALARVARLARASADALERMAGDTLDRHATRDRDAILLPVNTLQALPRDVAAETLRLAMARLGFQAPLRAWAQRGLRRVLASPPPRRPFRLGGVTLEVSVGRIRVGRRRPRRLPARDIAVPGRVALPEAGLALEATLRQADDYEIPRERHRVAFDADALPRPLVVRGRHRGDRLTPFGDCAPRRLKRLLIAARIARWDRALVPIVEAGAEIVWIGGVRRGALAPVTPATQQILELTLVRCERLDESGASSAGSGDAP